MTEKQKQELEIGKIYFLSYGGTTIVGRFKGFDTCNLFFYDYLHYWSGYESFRKGDNQYCVTSGIIEVRRATDCEKYTLLRYEIEHNCI